MSDSIERRSWIVPHDTATGNIMLALRHHSINNGGQFGLIGGGVDAGETYTEAAIRELKEESLIKAEASELSLYFEVEGKNMRHMFFLLPWRHRTPAMTMESGGYLWIEAASLFLYDLPLHKSALHLKNVFNDARMLNRLKE